MADRFLCRFCGQNCEVESSRPPSVRTWLPDCIVLYRSPKTGEWYLYDAVDFLERNVAGAFDQIIPANSTGLDHHMHIVHRKCFSFISNYIRSVREPLPGDTDSRYRQLVTIIGEIFASLPKATISLWHMLPHGQGNFAPHETRPELETRRQIPWAPIPAPNWDTSWNVENSDWGLEDPDMVPQPHAASVEDRHQQAQTSADPPTVAFELRISPEKTVTLDEDCMRAILQYLPVADQNTMCMYTQARQILDEGLSLEENVQVMSADFRYPDFRLNEIETIFGLSRHDLGKKAQWLGHSGLFKQFAAMNRARQILTACADEFLQHYDIVQYFGAVKPLGVQSSQHELNRQALADCTRLKRLCFPSLAITSSINPATLHCLSGTSVNNPVEDYWWKCPCFDGALYEREEQKWPDDTIKITSVARLPQGIRDVKSLVVYSLYPTASSSLNASRTSYLYSGGGEDDFPGPPRPDNPLIEGRAYIVGIRFVLQNGEEVNLGYCRSVWHKYGMSLFGDDPGVFRQGHLKPQRMTMELGYSLHSLTFKVIGEGRVGGITILASNGESVRYLSVDVNPYAPAAHQKWEHSFDDSLERLQYLSSRGFDVLEGQETWVFPQHVALAFSSIHATDGRIISLDLYEAATPEISGWQIPTPRTVSSVSALIASKPISLVLALLLEVRNIWPCIPSRLRTAYLTSAHLNWCQLDRPATCIRFVPLDQNTQDLEDHTVGRVETLPGFHLGCWKYKDHMVIGDHWDPPAATIDMPMASEAVSSYMSKWYLLWSAICDQMVRWLREICFGRLPLVVSTVISGEDCGSGYMSDVAYYSPNGTTGTIDVIRRHWDPVLPSTTGVSGRILVPYRRGDSSSTQWSDALVSGTSGPSRFLELNTKNSIPYYGTCASITVPSLRAMSGLNVRSAILSRLGSFPIARAMVKVQSATELKFDPVWS